MVDEVALSDVTVKRQGTTILRGLSAILPTRGITVILGPNGAGKSTFLRTLCTMERVTDGAVAWSHKQQTVTPSKAFVFQTPTVLRRSVLDNLTYPLWLKGASRTHRAEAGRAIAQQFGLERHLHRRASDLSGGEKQVLALARALITNPDVLLMDEPTTNLDGATTRLIETAVLDFANKDKSVFLATHDLGQAKRLATRAVFLHKGALVDHQDAPSFFNSTTNAAVEAYLKGDIVE